MVCFRYDCSLLSHDSVLSNIKATKRSMRALMFRYNLGGCAPAQHEPVNTSIHNQELRCFIEKSHSLVLVTLVCLHGLELLTSTCCLHRETCHSLDGCSFPSTVHDISTDWLSISPWMSLPSPAVRYQGWSLLLLRHIPDLFILWTSKQF